MSEIAAIVMAAGRASRFGAGADDSKVVAQLGGTSLVSRVVDTALASQASVVHVVTGHAAAQVAAAVAGRPVVLVPNPNYADGMASSLKVGIASLPVLCEGCLILLADMPMVKRETLDGLIEAYEAAGGRYDALVPTYQDRHGNPVLLTRAMFEGVKALDGDEGARKLLRASGNRLGTHVVEDAGIMLDIDTRDVLAGLRTASLL